MAKSDYISPSILVLASQGEPLVGPTSGVHYGGDLSGEEEPDE